MENMTAQECAEYLRVQPSWLYQRRKKLGIPYIKLGNKVIFQREAVDKWLNEHTVSGIKKN